MAQYKLVLKNDSTQPGFFCVFQEYKGELRNVKSLAWLIASANPGVTEVLEWDIAYGAVFSKCGKLKDDVTFTQSQVVTLDPQEAGNNSIQLTGNEFGYMFLDSTSEQKNKVPTGHMDIFTDKNIVNNDVAVGISMSGKSIYAVDATPNYIYDFEVTPNYKVIFCQDIHEGKVLSVTQMTNNIADVVFDEGVYEMTLTLDKQNEWSLSRS